MGGACTKSKPGDVSHPVSTVEVRIGQQNQQTRNAGQNDDLISIVSLKSRMSMKKQVNIGYYLVENVKKLEKDNKKVTKQWKKVLDQYKKNNKKVNLEEKIFTKNTESVLFSFKKNKFNEFQSLIESGIPLNMRWNVWKVQLFNKDIYDEKLYEKLLDQEIDEHYECAILKDLPRTFPTHPYFQSKEIGGGGFLKLNQLNKGQRQLYNVLKALSIHMPNVGYTQGMNFVVGFLLMMSAGNESESFWIFALLGRDPNFLFMGLFEETLPLMHILIYIFECKFKLVMPDLYDYFQNILLDSMLWVWKWFITVYLYSFPIEIVAKLWDYIIINGGLSTISLGLALAEYYKSEFLRLDMEDIQTLLREMKETDMLLDKNSKYYLDFAKLQKAAKKYTITSEFASKCVSNFVKEKKTDNMYSKFYIMRSQNEKQAIEWIHNSVQERVKLSAAQTVMHLGSVLRQNHPDQSQQINQNIEESVGHQVFLQQQKINHHIYNSQSIGVSKLSQDQNQSNNNQNIQPQHDKPIPNGAISNSQIKNKSSMSAVSPLQYQNNNMQAEKSGSDKELNKHSQIFLPSQDNLPQIQQQVEELDNSSRQFINRDDNNYNNNNKVPFTDQNNTQQNFAITESNQPTFTIHKNKDYSESISQLVVNNKENFRPSPNKFENEIIRFTSLSEMQDDIPDHLTNADPDNNHHHHLTHHQVGSNRHQMISNSLSQKVQQKDASFKNSRIALKLEEKISKEQ